MEDPSKRAQRDPITLFANCVLLAVKLFMGDRRGRSRRFVDVPVRLLLSDWGIGDRGRW